MSNKIRTKLLGMPIGTARGRLVKMLLFKLLKEFKIDRCYRCTEVIESIGDLSIEHEVSWQLATNPRETYFDLDNVSFSHLTCNSGAHNREKTHCSNGHKLTEYRRCPECLLEARRRFRNLHIEQDTSEYRRMKGWRE